MGKIIPFQRSDENAAIDKLINAIEGQVKNETTALAIKVIEDNLLKIQLLQSQLKLAVDTIHDQFKAAGASQCDLECNFHDINITVHDLDTCEGNINRFIDYVNKTRSHL